ncbi:MAG TPA: ClpXP protease specificity-enhancing factor SspB, partial [Vicinamibacteria bacterium]|nr:ClpXP protease specificity-enhancing factor SspB [Vicinamibacteria bacterium]
MAERIDYPALVRSALLTMVRRLLERVALEGLPGEHHLYLGFRTDAPGVEIPAGLRRTHPQEM